MDYSAGPNHIWCDANASTHEEIDEAHGHLTDREWGTISRGHRHLCYATTCALMYKISGCYIEPNVFNARRRVTGGKCQAEVG